MNESTKGRVVAMLPWEHWSKPISKEVHEQYLRNHRRFIRQSGCVLVSLRANHSYRLSRPYEFKPMYYHTSNVGKSIPLKTMFGTILSMIDNIGR